jgi:hypothetical protein
MKNYRLTKSLTMLDPTKEVVIKVVDENGNKPNSNYRIIAIQTDESTNSIILKVTTVK